MKILFEAMSALHLVGVAAIAWGFFSQLRGTTRGINVAMLHGASTQFATGLVMVGLAESGVVDENLNMGIISIKLLAVIVILAACVKGRRETGDATKWWTTVGVLWVLNVALGLSLGD